MGDSPNHLGHVSWCRFCACGDYLQSKIHLFVFFSWQSNERLNRHIGFNVIFAAVYYDVLLIFHDVNILLVYM